MPTLFSIFGLRFYVFTEENKNIIIAHWKNAENFKKG
jgi:hypothetical protein